MDSKLLAIIIAVAKKEASANKVDITSLQRTVEEQLKEFHKRSPILDTPTFSVVNGTLYCKWDFGPTLNLGNIVGPKGDKGDKGDKGLPGSDGLKGDRGYTGDKGSDGSNGSDGAPGRNGKDGRDGKAALRGSVGPAGERGAPGGEGTPGKDGKDAVAPPAGADGKDGLDGEDGSGIDKVWVDENYHLTVRLTSGIVIDAGYVRGPAGISSGKGGRVTGGYVGGGGGGSGGSIAVTVVSAEYIGQNLILTMSNGTTIDAGAVPVTPATGSLTWIDYVSNWLTEPALVGTTTEGEVYSYGYTTSTYYRLIPNDASLEQDSFYENWNGSALSNIVIERAMNI
jgi:hypothetical protein